MPINIKDFIDKDSKGNNLKSKVLLFLIAASATLNGLAFSVEKHKSTDGKFKGVCNDGFVYMESWHVYKDVVLYGMKDCKNHGGFRPPYSVPGKELQQQGSSVNKKLNFD